MGTISIYIVPLNYSPDYYIGSWRLVNASKFFGQIPITTGKESTKAILLNKSGNILKEYKNYILFNRQKRMFSTHLTPDTSRLTPHA